MENNNQENKDTLDFTLASSYTLHSLKLRDVRSLLGLRTSDTVNRTPTILEQMKVENSVYKKLEELNLRILLRNNIKLLEEKHRNYLCQCLNGLNSHYHNLDASRPWLVYWIVHSLSLMSMKFSDQLKSAIIKFLNRCQHPSGGFGGGPGQYPHLAPTYASILALVTIGSHEAYNIIDRSKLRAFLWRMRQADGSFTMTQDGEIDVRGIYCALTAATLTNIYDERLFSGSADYLVRCQTYEGGFAGAPYLEAHGGYSFCGLAALIMLNKGHLCDYKALLRWTLNRQMKLEGGFQGRTNKLVDGCYSFWQGGAFPLIYSIINKEEHIPSFDEHLYNEGALQEYILLCCQHGQGGLIDKPGKDRDVYHTCYTLSGLSSAQHFGNNVFVLGSPDNELEYTHPIYNVRPDYVRKAMIYFENLPEVSNDEY